MASVLERCIEAYPSRFTHWRAISQNPNISFDFIKHHPEFPWDWYYVSINPSITIDHVLSNISEPWNFHSLITNPSITWDNIVCTPSIEWEYHRFMFNPNFTIEIVENNDWVKWDYSLLIHSNVTMENLLKYAGSNLDKFTDRYNIFNFSKSPAVAWDFIESHPKINWDWVGISQNPNITRRIVLDNKERPWDWRTLSKRGIITRDMLQLNFSLSFSVANMCSNPHVTIDMIIEREGTWCMLDNPNITFDDIVTHNNKHHIDDLAYNLFDKHPALIEEVETRKQWKAVYGSVIDLLNMRIRDINAGLRSSMI